MIISAESQRNKAFVEAVKLYKDFAFPQTKLITDIVEYATFHYVYCSPDCIILARVEQGHHMPFGWFVHLAVGQGALKRFFDLAPFELPFVGFARPERGRDSKWHEWHKLKRVCSINRRSKTS